jgi:hypothetical protein
MRDRKVLKENGLLHQIGFQRFVEANSNIKKLVMKKEVQLHMLLFILNLCGGQEPFTLLKMDSLLQFI